MKKFATLAALTLLTQTAFASTPATTPKFISLDVDLHYQFPIATDATDEFNLKNTLKLATNNHNWTIVNTGDDKDDSGFIMLSKIEDADAKQAKVDFLIINTRGKASVVSQPKLLVAYGKKGELASTDKNTTTHLAVIANV